MKVLSKIMFFTCVYSMMPVYIKQQEIQAFRAPERYLSVPQEKEMRTELR